MACTLAASGCGAPDRTVAPQPPLRSPTSHSISDAVHGNGNARFYFLPPMVPAPSPTGTFDASLSPVVEVCEWSGTCSVTVARFTTAGTPASASIRVDTTAQQYIVNWDTKACLSGPCTLDPLKTYRLRVTAAGVELGYADLDVVSNGAQLKHVQTGEYIGLVDGRTLPVKFRIEQGIVGTVRVIPNPASVEVGRTTPLSAVIEDLHGAPLTGRTVSWSSASATVAVVSGAGVVTGASLGCTTITATVEGVSGNTALCVTAPPVIDVNSTYLWRTSVSGTSNPMLAQWSDGTILVASLCCGSTFNVTSPSPGVVTKTPFAHLGNRPTIWIPPSGPYAEIELSHYDRIRAQTRANTTVWDNTDFGCCGVGPFPAPIDPATGILFRHSRRVELDLRTGLHVYAYNDLGDIYHDIYTTPDYIWEVRYHSTTVYKRSRNSTAVVAMSGLPSNHTDPSKMAGALTADQGYVHVTPDGGGTLLHFAPSGLAWTRSVPGLTAPVISGEDLVILGAATGSASEVRAYRLSDGALAWSVPTAGAVKDLIVGDRGNLYVLLSNQMMVLAQSDGSLRQSYINLPSSTELLLSRGTMYVLGPSELLALTVDSYAYAATSPWPVRFGDNQRTTNLPASRVR
ncbi:MAG: Ig-like domain-containing protein [Gemmatimonadaceae bacterium]